MKKKFQLIVLSLITILAITGAIFTGIKSEIQTQTTVSMDIKIENGQASPKTFSSWIDIDKAGKYELYAEWWQEEEPGYVSGLVVKDQQNNSIYALTGNMVKASSVPLQLTPGRYNLEYVIFENLDDINNFVKEYIGADKTFYEFAGCKDGTYSLDYSLHVYPADANYLLITVLLGCIAFVCLTCIIIILFKKNRTERKYDERQLLVRGNAFKYAFFTMLIYNVIAYILYLCEANLPLFPDTLFMLGVLVGLMVFVTYSIWNDAYYALNENKKQVNTFLIVIGILNLGIGISHLFDGTAIVNGKLAVGSINLICGILLIYVFIVNIIKFLVDKRSE